MASNTYEMTGSVKTIFEPMTFPSGFSKREFLLTMEDDYPQDVKFTCIKERAAQLDNVTPGERVSVSFRIRCREWQGKYFIDLEGFRINKKEGDGTMIEYENSGGGFEDSGFESGGLEPIDDDPPLPF